MALIYRFFRHVHAPKDPKLQNDPDYDFRRLVSATGVMQGHSLGIRLMNEGSKPVIVFHSESPRAIVTAHLACSKDELVAVPFVPLKEFWPSDREFFGRMWAFACRYQFDTQAYLRDSGALALYKAYGLRIKNEMQRVMRTYSTTSGEILIFGHGVWNCFIAWAIAGFPEAKGPFFVHLKECDELRVINQSVIHVPFQKAPT